MQLFNRGINGYVEKEYERRTIPSAGARYPIDLYLIIYKCHDLESGVYHYNVKDNVLENIGPIPERDLMYKIINNQDFAKTADVFVLFSATFERTMSKYGERGYRYIYLDAGHIAQNLILMATAFEVKNTLIGGFDDNLINHLLNLDSNKESIIYICALGR